MLGLVCRLLLVKAQVDLGAGRRGRLGKGEGINVEAYRHRVAQVTRRPFDHIQSPQGVEWTTSVGHEVRRYFDLLYTAKSRVDRRLL
jgi:hypothetical protein